MINGSAAPHRHNIQPPPGNTGYRDIHTTAAAAT